MTEQELAEEIHEYLTTEVEVPRDWVDLAIQGAQLVCLIALLIIVIVRGG